MRKAGVLGFLMVFIFFPAAIFLSSQTEESANILEKNKEGVVSLFVYGNNKNLIAKGVGFGVTEDVIATSYHLVSPAGDIEAINVKGKKMKVEGIVSVDRNLDVVMLRIKGKVEALSLGNSDEVTQGARAFALGADEVGEIVVSEGMVTNIYDLTPSLRLIDPSLAIPDGFLGGPLISLDGQVMGLVLLLEKSARVAIPVNAWKGLPKSAKATSFKDWTSEDYLATFEGAFLAGKIFSLINDTANAQKFLERVVKINPATIEAHFLLANVYSSQRNYSSAVAAYNRVIEQEPNRAEAHFGVGNIYFKMQNWNEAIASLEKAVSLNIENKEALFYIGNAHEELRNFEKAADAYERYLNLNPVNPWTGYLRLGLCRMELNQFEGAVAALEEAQKSQPQDLKVNYSLAQAYQKAGQFEKADQTYRNLAQLKPDDAISYFGFIVKMYDEGGQYEKAIEPAQKVIELNPKSEMAIYNLGIMYFKLQRYDEAIATFNRAIELKPDYEYAYYNIGLSYYSQKKYRESIEAFKNFVALVPDNADAFLNLGVSYMMLKDFENALEPLRKCVELRPDSGAALYNLAIVYLNLKDNYSARDVYKTLVTVDPDLAEKLKKYLR